MSTSENEQALRISEDEVIRRLTKAGCKCVKSGKLKQTKVFYPGEKGNAIVSIVKG